METVTESTFDYLKTWSRDRLYKRLEEIRPSIDFLLNMHNAGGFKTVGFSAAFMTGPEVKRLDLIFSTAPGYAEGFPETLETFIHNFCTFLCAEKWAIEFLLERRDT